MPSQVLESGMRLNRQRYVVGERLGAGKFGEVYKAYDQKDKKNVAMKAVAKIVEEREDESALGEARILILLKDCEGVPQLFDYFSFRNHSVLVMELFKTDFLHLLRNHPKKSFSKQSLLHFAYHAVKTIESIHQRGFLHRDLKPANFFLPLQQTRTMKLAIGDLGMAVKFESGGTRHPGMRLRVPSKDFGFAASPYHSLGMSRGKPAQESDDLEMLAVSLLFCRGIRPFIGTPLEMTAKKEELHRNPGTIAKGANTWMRDIVKVLLNQPYASRPDYESVFIEIDRLSNVPSTRDFEIIRNADGTFHLKDF